MGIFAPEVTKQCKITKERATLRLCAPSHPGWGWSKLVWQVLEPGEIRLLREMNNHKYLIPAPRDRQRKRGACGGSCPLSEKWEPQGAACKVWGVTAARGNGHIVPWLDICLVMGCYLPLGHQRGTWRPRVRGSPLGSGS